MITLAKRRLRKLAQKIESTIQLISSSPLIFPRSKTQNIHKVVILKYNTMYYRIKDSDIEIISFFSNRQNTDKIKF